MSSSDSARYDEAIEVKPSNSRKASTGSVHDPRSGKYPSTHEFASEATPERVQHGRMARRPGGHYRGAHGFHTPNCTCGKHPCVCDQHAVACHDNVNVGDKKKSMGRHM